MRASQKNVSSEKNEEQNIEENTGSVGDDIPDVPDVPVTDDPGYEAPIVPVETDKIICIDPGHGWSDAGCISPFTDKDGNPIYEKDINLAIAKYMKEELERYGYGVVMIRESDDQPSLAGGAEGIVARTQWVNGQEKIALMFSIHCDSYDDDEAEGTRVYWYDPEVAELGELLSTTFAAEKLTSSKLALFPETKGKFYPLTACEKPSVLIECGYLTNEKDTENLTDPAYQKAFGKALAHSVDSFMRTRL